MPDNPSSHVEFQSITMASSSRSSSLSESVKDIVGTINSGKNISDNLQTSDVSDFITAAEILPVPSDVENTHIISSSNVGTPSQSVCSVVLSSTPPALHHNHHHVKTEYTSSSLPNSPYLSSISPKADVAVRNLQITSGKELLQESGTTQQESPDISENPFLSQSDTCSILSMPLPHDTSTNNNASECEHSVTIIAYDNLGFESDLYF